MWENGTIARVILILSTGRRQVVSFTPRSLHLQIKISMCPWIRGWIESTAGRKMLWIWDTYQLPLPGTEPRFLGRHVRSLLSTLTELFRVTVQFYITIDKTRSIQE
jgi:hypothetical protein